MLPLAEKAMLRFRKKVGQDFRQWHFADRCAGWPRSAYVEREDHPPVDYLCDECLSVYGDAISENYRRAAKEHRRRPRYSKKPRPT